MDKIDLWINQNSSWNINRTYIWRNTTIQLQSRVCDEIRPGN